MLSLQISKMIEEIERYGRLDGPRIVRLLRECKAAIRPKELGKYEAQSGSDVLSINNDYRIVLDDLIGTYFDEPKYRRRFNRVWDNENQNLVCKILNTPNDHDRVLYRKGKAIYAVWRDDPDNHVFSRFVED